MKTIIVIPCYNEALRLPKDKFIAYSEDNPDIKFLFVNDGSKDNTLFVLQELCKDRENFFYIDLEKNSGKAEAVRQGMCYSVDEMQADYIGFWDADLATPLEEIGCFLDLISKHDFDIVTGLRLQRLGAGVKRKKLRHYLGRCFATAASVTLKLPVYDTQCGAKLYNKRVVNSLFSAPFTSRWLFDIELLARYITVYGYEKAMTKIYEHPIFIWEDVAGSQLKLKDFFKAPYELFVIKKRYLMKKHLSKT